MRYMGEARMVTMAGFGGRYKRGLVLASALAVSYALLGVAGRAEESAERIATEPDAAASIQSTPAESGTEQGNETFRARWKQFVAGVAEATAGLDSLAPKSELVPGLPKAFVAAHQTCFAKGRDKPDCGVAARFVCSTAGYEIGKAIDVASGQVCRGGLPVAAIPSSSGADESGACKSKTWVTLAACW